MSKVATKVFRIDVINDCIEALEYSADVIRGGGLVVFPTETVYGLGADATNALAAEKIYMAKGRPSDNPLIIHIAEPSDAEKYTYTNDVYYRLAECFMPGPLTVILRAKDTIPKKTRGGLDTVAVRCPVHPVARKLIEMSGVPIAAPSANISGGPSPTTFSHVFKDMEGRVDVIIDGGESDIGLESTIVKIEDNGDLVLLRPGKITIEDLFLKGFDVTVSSAVVNVLKDGETALSPGMKYKHYAPRATFCLLEGTAESILGYLNERNKRIALFSYDEDVEYYTNNSSARIYPFGSRYRMEEQAHLLFNLLRQADEDGAEEIYAPLPSTEGLGLALYNRMIRASAHKIIRL